MLFFLRIKNSVVSAVPFCGEKDRAYAYPDDRRSQNHHKKRGGNKAYRFGAFLNRSLCHNGGGAGFPPPFSENGRGGAALRKKRRGVRNKKTKRGFCNKASALFFCSVKWACGAKPLHSSAGDIIYRLCNKVFVVAECDRIISSVNLHPAKLAYLLLLGAEGRFV